MIPTKRPARVRRSGLPARKERIPRKAFGPWRYLGWFSICMPVPYVVSYESLDSFWANEKGARE